jgi:hypothetical protein
MSSIHRPGEASFSTFNIRRRGEVAPKVESGAFRASGASHGVSGLKRCERAPWRVGLAEGGAQQRPDASCAAGTGTGTTRQARVGGCGWNRHGRSRGGRGSSRFGPGLPPTPRRTGHVRLDHAGPRTGYYFTGYYVTGCCFTGCCFTGYWDAGAHDTAGHGRPGHGTPWFSPASLTGRLCVFSHRRACGPEFLVDSAIHRNPADGPSPDQPGGGEVLVVTDRCKHVAPGPAGRPGPPIRRSGASASSDVDGDVRSAPRTWSIVDGPWRASLRGTAIVRRSRLESSCGL